ncbi:MAG: FAD synthase [Candidatus Micrarchaeota archaeon]|nr:FAD synthase [Candidatus Micrarchaeota archaeon]
MLSIVRSVIRNLYLMQVRDNGIGASDYAKLYPGEKRMLERKGKRYFLTPQKRKRLTVVLTGGVFDVIHIGHVLALSEAAKLGNVLIVVVARDEFIRKKGRKPLHNQKYRTEIVGAMRMVNLAVPGAKDMTETLRRVKPDVIAYGYDQKPIFRPKGVKVVKLGAHANPNSARTSKIIQKVGI